MNSYEVVRPFGSYGRGAILRDSDFISPRRALQLMEQRYLRLVPAPDAQEPPGNDHMPREKARAGKGG